MPSSKSSLDKRDIYYRLGKSAGYRARSAWKLIHLDEEFGLFDSVGTVVDLCAAPGSWSQVVGERLGAGMADGSAKLVSLDLQPMAPLKHTTILQCDITVPSTIPLVLSNLRPSATPSSSSATEIRKADLVICDGAPDVTGVHDLDAYLHYQLLLAAITLTLTILRKGGTAVYKVFLNPMDPRGEMLKSQVAPLFGGLMRDLELESDEEHAPEEMAVVNGQGEKEQTVYGQIEDERRQHGVWMCKPRSSRAGSGEAFLVCRGFDPSILPLPSAYSTAALSELEKQTTGTITLDSLSDLVSPNDGSTTANWTETEWKRWNAIKGWLGTGSLQCTSQNETAAPVDGSAASETATTPKRTSTLLGSVGSPVIMRTDATPGSGSQAQVPEAEGTIPPSSAGLSGHASLNTLTRQRGYTMDSPSVHAYTSASSSASYGRAPGRKASAESDASMSPTMPHHLMTGSNGSQWSGPSPLPSPITLNGQPDWLAVTQGQGGSLAQGSSSGSGEANKLSPRLSAHAVARRSIDEGYKRLSGGASGHSLLGDAGSSSAGASGTWSHLNLATPSADGAVSPALSSSSKTDLFFKNTESLPTPPKPLTRAPSLNQSALSRSGSLGKGLPPHLRARREFEGVERDRAVTMPGTPAFGAVGNGHGHGPEQGVMEEEQHNLPPPVPVSAGSRTAGLFSTDFSAAPVGPAPSSSVPAHRSGEDMRMRSASTPYPGMQRPALSLKEVDAIGQSSHIRRPSSIFNNDSSHLNRANTLHGHESAHQYGNSPAMSTLSGFSQGFPESPLVGLPSDRSLSVNMNINSNGPVKRPFSDRRESQIVREWRRAPEEEGLDAGDVLEPLDRPRRGSRPDLPSTTSSSSASSDDLKGKRDKELDLKRRASGMIDTLGRAFVRTGQHLSMTSVKEHEQAPNGLASSDGVQESPSAVLGKRKWKLKKRLGDGAFSAVWLAEAVDDTDIPISSKSSSAVAAVKIQVALKLLPRHLTSTNERTHISFLREVEVLSSIRHPNVVGFVDDFETPGYYALALETAEGGELFECVQSKAWASLVRPTRNVQDADRRRSIGEGLVKRILRELCAAVGFLHAVGIVHRDIKLENILLTQPLIPHLDSSNLLSIIPSGPLIKLTDFGLSRFIDADAPLLETRCGSESFAAPEIIMGRAYDGRDTDSWAVGVVGYAIVVGELPFDALPTSAGAGFSTPGGFLEDEKESRRKRMMRIAKGQYAFPDGVGSEGVRGLVGRLLVRDPKKRWRVEEAVKSDAWLREGREEDVGQW